MSNFFIPEPCHENWNKMTPQEQGRHCDVCSKVVVDFTKKKEEEINDILSSATGRVCGHFRVDQLNHEAQMKTFRQPVNLFTKNWKYFALATFGIFAFSKKMEAQKLRGKVAPRLSGDIAPVEEHNSNKSMTTLYGTVHTAAKGYASGAEVILSSGGKEIGRTKTIANGSYVIRIQPGQMVGRQVDIVVYYTGSSNKYIYGMMLEKATTRLNITLEEERYMLKGEIQYVEPPKKDDDPKAAAVLTDTAKTGLVPEVKNDTAFVCRFQAVEPQTKDSIPKISVLAQFHAADTSGRESHDQDSGSSTGFVIRKEDVVSTIYPNPAGTNATVYCNRTATFKIEVYDEKGALKMTKAFYGDRTALDVSGFARGNYYVKVHDNEGHANVMKLVKQ